MHEDPSKGVILQGVKELFVENADNFFDILYKGNQKRTIGKTNANETSSRSHALLKINIENKDKEGPNASKISCGRFILVDLAGSEKNNPTIGNTNSLNNNKNALRQQRKEKKRLEREKKEQERLEQERIEKERLEKERLERQEKKRLERERKEKEKLERLEQERIERERLELLEKEKREKIRLATASEFDTPKDAENRRNTKQRFINIEKDEKQIFATTPKYEARHKFRRFVQNPEEEEIKKEDIKERLVMIKKR